MGTIKFILLASFFLVVFFQVYTHYCRLMPYFVSYITNERSDWNPTTDKFNTFFSLSSLVLPLFVYLLVSASIPDGYKIFALVVYIIFSLLSVFFSEKLWRNKNVIAKKQINSYKEFGSIEEHQEIKEHCIDESILVVNETPIVNISKEPLKTMYKTIVAEVLEILTNKTPKEKCIDEEIKAEFNSLLGKLENKGFYNKNQKRLIVEGYEDADDLVPYHVLIYFFKNTYLKKAVHATTIIDLFNKHFSIPENKQISSNNYSKFKDRFVKKDRSVKNDKSENKDNFYSDLVDFANK